jgi:hypothetical protein
MATAFEMDCELCCRCLAVRNPQQSNPLGGRHSDHARSLCVLPLWLAAAATHVQSKQEREFFPSLYFLSRFPSGIPLYPVSLAPSTLVDTLQPRPSPELINPAFSVFHFRVSASRSALTFPGAILRVLAVFNRQSYRHSALRVSCSSILGLDSHPLVLFANLGLLSPSCQTRKMISL